MLDFDTILERCKKGDRLAWEALVKKTQARVYGLAFYYVRDKGEAEDLAQEIFVKVYHNLHTLESGSRFMPWMIRIARNCSINRLRRIKARPPARDLVVGDDLQLANSEVSPEQGYLSGEKKDLFYRAMAQLGEQAREILLLKEIQQLKVTEIATILSLPVGTIKSRASRARVDLAKAILTLDPSYGSQGAAGR